MEATNTSVHLWLIKKKPTSLTHLWLLLRSLSKVTGNGRIWAFAKTRGHVGAELKTMTSLWMSDTLLQPGRERYSGFRGFWRSGLRSGASVFVCVFCVSVLSKSCCWRSRAHHIIHTRNSFMHGQKHTHTRWSFYGCEDILHPLPHYYLHWTLFLTMTPKLNLNL